MYLYVNKKREIRLIADLPETAVENALFLAVAD
jgi:hypothetical protein